MSEITKKALAESLKKQMQTIPLAKITVNDVVDECGLNRRTLYYYFRDIYDLLEWIFKTEIKKVLGKNKTYGTWQKGFLEILSYLCENQKVVLNTYNSIDRDCLENHLHNEIFNLILEVVNELAKDLNVSAEDKKYIVKFYEIALVGIISDWIRNNMTEYPEKIIDNLDKIIGGDIYRALLKYEKKGKSN
ncbi:TetR/AcrR family transcriptional regulator C-terminal domain-containing protein [Clostridium ganghwense]|uniref:TetR/AcrR family transcriptional regulator C-terminal domain-containing protein n=1 Tax=Clostridium ganghwense TaxID=312089 RepID=A0ABT4CRQ5_9CLOT|nr:TetR/AcrR family transcriptional regulator C-terminal domain-containing protein [Clostridium ganghwense]MCY6371750.1 TetR/AcrR family transcriptional regulator C-terminal domain-containing protein [Clostridium ganghwense]